MKRSTKKVIFISSMMLTIVSLFAFGGRHHHYADRYGCGHGSYENECHQKNSNSVEKERTHWWNQEKNQSSETH